MTFERAADLVYLKISAPNSVLSWCYSEKNVSANVVGAIITPRDTIPHATDLQFVQGITDSVAVSRA